MGAGAEPLATFVRDHVEEILTRWERAMAPTPQRVGWSPAVLRDELAKVLVELAAELEARLASAQVPRAEGQVIAEGLSEHARQRVSLGATVTMLAKEILALRDAIERTWPAASTPEARRALDALHVVIEGILVASIERFSSMRNGLLDAVDTIVREQRPSETLEQTLQRILHTLMTNVGGRIAGIDTIAILLREGDTLRVRAALGPEEAAVGFSVRIGEGFAGRIAAERAPWHLTSASSNPCIVNDVLRESGIRVLYGVPLIREDELIGVAHMGSTTAEDFSPEAQTLFRAIMERVASVLHARILREHLESERAQNRAFVTNAPTILFTKDLEGRYLSINHRALAELALAPEAFVGHTDDDVFPPEVARALRASDRQVIETGRALEFEDVIEKAGERHLYLTVKFPIRDARGRIAMIGGIATEITERARRLRAQQLLAELGGLIASSLDRRELLSRFAELVVPAIADGVVVELVRPDGTRHGIVRHRDRGVSDHTGALQLAEATLRAREPRCLGELTPAQLDELGRTEADRAQLRALAPVSLIQLPLVARGRDLGTMLLLGGRDHPRFAAFDLHLAEAIAIRMSLAIDNAQLYETSRRATRSREEVLGIVAHDLRNPLGTIALSAASLVHQLAPEADRERRGLSAIARAAAEMEKLVSDLLDHYAIERGEIAVEMRRCSTRGLLEEVREAHRARIEAAGLTLEVAQPEDLPDVAADHDRILQVFGNLIGNAVKFTPPGGRVTVGAVHRDGTVELYVRDTGIGFSTEAAEHVFDRYWKADRADRRGVGLGLAISKGIIDAHGGRIWAASTPGRGTTMSFTVPAALPETLGLLGASAP